MYGSVWRGLSPRSAEAPQTGGLSPRSAGAVPTVGGACPHDSASENGRVALPADNRRYLKTRLSKADLVAAFAAAEVVQGM